jgi:hypothetical protein
MTSSVEDSNDRHPKSSFDLREAGLAFGVRPQADVAWVKLGPEVRRKIYGASRSGEKDHPVIKVFVEEVVRAAARLLM